MTFSHNAKNHLGVASNVLALLATFVACCGGYYDLRARCDTNTLGLQLLREKQDAFEKTALVRWARVDDILDELLTRGIRNETKIDAILSGQRDMTADLRAHVINGKNGDTKQ